MTALDYLYDETTRRLEKELRANPESIRFHLDMAALDDPRAAKFSEKDFWDSSVVEEIRRSGFIDTVPLMMPSAHPGESGLSHCANNLSTLAVTDSAGDALVFVVLCSCPRTFGVMDETSAMAVTTNIQAMVRTFFIIVALFLMRK